MSYLGHSLGSSSLLSRYGLSSRSQVEVDGAAHYFMLLGPNNLPSPNRRRQGCWGLEAGQRHWVASQ